MNFHDDLMQSIREAVAITRVAKAINWYGYAICGVAMEMVGVRPHCTTATEPTQEDIEEIWERTSQGTQQRCIKLARRALYGSGEEEGSAGTSNPPIPSEA